MLFGVVITCEPKNWTLDFRTEHHFYRARDDPPACPNASGHLAAVEVVIFPKLKNQLNT